MDIVVVAAAVVMVEVVATAAVIGKYNNFHRKITFR